MKLYFENKTAEITSQGSLFEAIASVSGAQVHSPCGGHGTCRKCTAAAVFCEGAVITEEIRKKCIYDVQSMYLDNCIMPWYPWQCTGKNYEDVINRYKDLIKIREIGYADNRGPGMARQYATSAESS